MADPWSKDTLSLLWFQLSSPKSISFHWLSTWQSVFIKERGEETKYYVINRSIIIKCGLYQAVRSNDTIVNRNYKKYQVIWSKMYGGAKLDTIQCWYGKQEQRKNCVHQSAMFYMTLIFLHKPINYSVVCLLYGVVWLGSVSFHRLSKELWIHE